MKFAIVKKESLSVLRIYEAEVKQETSAHQSWLESEPICAHIEVPSELDSECLKAISYEETVVVEDEPERIIPAVTHEEKITVVDVPEQIIPAVTHDEDVVVVDIPESIDPETSETIPAVTHIETVTIVDEPEQIIPAVTHEEVVIVIDIPEQIIPAVTHEEIVTRYGLELDPDLVLAKDIKLKQEAVGEAYNRMNNDVYNQMQLVFGTTKSDSATAFFETWLLMVSNPELFINEGLRVDKEIGTFHPGQDLNTIEKVQTYAQARIDEANQYSVYRMKRIEQFRDERAALLT